MSESKHEQKGQTGKKYKILSERLKEEDPEIMKERDDFLNEIEKTWRKISPFIGEERAYGLMSLTLTDDIELRGMPLDFILWFVLFKKISEKLDKELKWFKDNRETLEMIVKEYLERQRFR